MSPDGTSSKCCAFPPRLHCWWSWWRSACHMRYGNEPRFVPGLHCSRERYESGSSARKRKIIRQTSVILFDGKLCTNWTGTGEGVIAHWTTWLSLTRRNKYNHAQYSIWPGWPPLFELIFFAASSSRPVPTPHTAPDQTFTQTQAAVVQTFWKSLPSNMIPKSHLCASVFKNSWCPLPLVTTSTPFKIVASFTMEEKPLRHTHQHVLHSMT